MGQSRRLLLVHSSLESSPDASGLPLPSTFSATFGREETKVLIVKNFSEVHSQGTVIIPR